MQLQGKLCTVSREISLLLIIEKNDGNGGGRGWKLFYRDRRRKKRRNERRREGGRKVAERESTAAEAIRSTKFTRGYTFLLSTWLLNFGKPDIPKFSSEIISRRSPFFFFFSPVADFCYPGQTSRALDKHSRETLRSFVKFGRKTSVRMYALQGAPRKSVYVQNFLQNYVESDKLDGSHGNVNGTSVSFSEISKLHTGQ